MLLYAVVAPAFDGGAIHNFKVVRGGLSMFLRPWNAVAKKKIKFIFLAKSWQLNFLRTQTYHNHAMYSTAQ